MSRTTFLRPNDTFPALTHHSYGRELRIPLSIRRTLDNAHEAPTQALEPGNINITLPPFIQPIPLNLGSHDIEYLRKKRAFDFPSDSRRNELIRCYLKFLHPILPLVDLAALLGAMEGSLSGQKISLLLFWAVMSSAVAYIDMSYLKTCFYRDRQAARKITLQIAHTLLDLNFETDPMVVTQSLLLTNFWYDRGDETRDICYHLDLGLSFVRKMLSENIDYTSPSQNSRFRLQKRIFWSCYVLHSFIAMALRQPVRMDLEEFRVPFLEVADFEIDQYPKHSSILMDVLPPGQELVILQEIANTTIGIINLCVCSSRIWEMLYSGTSNLSASPNAPQSGNVSKRCFPSPSAMVECERALDRWHHKYRFRLLLETDLSHQPTQRDQCDPVEITRAVLTSLYLGILTALYKPYGLHLGCPPGIPPCLIEGYRQRLCKAADKMTELHEYLRFRTLTRYQPNIGVTWLVSVSILYLFHAKTAEATIHAATMRKFESCMQTLDQMRKIYSSAEVAYRFLDFIQKRIEEARRTVFQIPDIGHRNHNSATVIVPCVEQETTSIVTDMPSAFLNTESLVHYGTNIAYKPSSTFTQNQTQQQAFPLDDFASWTVDHNSLQSYADGNFEPVSAPSMLPYLYTASEHDMSQHDSFITTESVVDYFNATNINFDFDQSLWEA